MINVYMDGLVEPVNPGGVGAIGFVVYRNGERIHQEVKIVGEGPEMSNNKAEYEALNEALSWLLRQGLSGDEITVFSDSRLLINQMLGRWVIKRGLYITSHNKAKKLAGQFPHISFRWIPREKNEEADLLTRQAYLDHRK